MGQRRRAYRWLIVGAVALGLVALGTPMASAAEVVEGGCSFLASDNAATHDNEGEIDVLIIAVDSRGFTPHIEGACWIEVDAAEVARTRLSFSDYGVVANAQPIWYPDGETTQLCWDYTVSASQYAGCADADEIDLAAPQCRDGLDNDLDGATDYPNDPQCSDPDDPTEDASTSSCTTAGPPICVIVTTSGVVHSVALPVAIAGPGQYVVGAVDTYRFPLPTGGTTTVPCVVLTVDSTPNACQAAGGTFVGRTATLVDRTESLPGSTPPLATVRVCTATYTLTVAGFGIDDFPAYALC